MQVVWRFWRSLACWQLLFVSVFCLMWSFWYDTVLQYHRVSVVLLESRNYVVSLMENLFKKKERKKIWVPWTPCLGTLRKKCSNEGERVFNLQVSLPQIVGENHNSNFVIIWSNMNPWQLKRNLPTWERLLQIFSCGSRLINDNRKIISRKGQNFGSYNR
jgi:hypothetical protein